MIKLNSTQSKIVLGIGHMAGMVDLAALPLWISVLMQDYHLLPQQAGLTVTLFLVGIVISSIILSPKYTRLNHRYVAAFGFAVASASFFTASKLSVVSESFSMLIILHVIAGLGAGAALSSVHGTIGKTENPHRLFGLVNVALGVLAIVLFALLPQATKQIGGIAIFIAFFALMACAAIVMFFFFPKVSDETTKHNKDENQANKVTAKILSKPAVWMFICVVSCLTLNQAMVFSFVDRIGDLHNFDRKQVETVLIVMSFINLTPGIVASLLQKRLSPIKVAIAGPCLQALFALSITHASSNFLLYAIPVAFYVTLVIFTHTFVFGLLAKIDPTGRAVAATPAMMMIGSAIGPLLGGVIVATVGYQGLAWATVIISCIAVALVIKAQSLLKKKDVNVSEPRMA
ncbi:MULTISPECIES: MFS transporter [unclassified Marinomonas]|jgi:predicted MFS family arabinose efflux permease|uniref:MFS transporter n=1 Tax=unclassified Marinomonas TaxID=196814 RepID=UPI000C1DDFB5|nr:MULTISPECIES: MFS transporter [unclassified Marinomonas]PJE55471.1 hypothetical protein TY87_10110 [Marinomonas sp. BSi20584]